MAGFRASAWSPGSWRRPVAQPSGARRSCPSLSGASSAAEGGGWRPRSPSWRPISGWSRGPSRRCCPEASVAGVIRSPSGSDGCASWLAPCAPWAGRGCSSWSTGSTRAALWTAIPGACAPSSSPRHGARQRAGRRGVQAFLPVELRPMARPRQISRLLHSDFEKRGQGRSCAGAPAAARPRGPPPRGGGSRSRPTRRRPRRCHDPSTELRDTLDVLGRLAWPWLPPRAARRPPRAPPRSSRSRARPGPSSARPTSAAVPLGRTEPPPCVAVASSSARTDPRSSRRGPRTGTLAPRSWRRAVALLSRSSRATGSP